MNVKRVYELLEKLKKCDSSVLENYKRVLKYIYQDVYLDCFDKPMQEELQIAINDGAKIGSIRYNSTFKLYNIPKKALSIFLDDESSIVSFLLELIDEKDQRFADLFFDKVSTYFDIIDNHFYTDHDFRVYSFVFNIYTMLAAYHCNKDNYDVYKDIVFNSSFLIDCFDIISAFSSSDKVSSSDKLKALNENRDIINLLVKCTYFSHISWIRDNLIDVLKETGYFIEFSNVNAFEGRLNFIIDCYKDYEWLLSFVSKDRLIDFNVFASFCNSDYFVFSIFPYYSKSLLIGDRFYFVNRKLKSLFLNIKYRNMAFEEIGCLDFSFFEFLNKYEHYRNKDSFISIFNIVFDSDTYYEYNSKMSDIKEAMMLFSNGLYDKSIELIKRLESDKHKKVLDGKILSWNDNSVCVVPKVNSLFEREKNIYKEMYSKYGINFDTLMYEIYENSDLFDFDMNLDKKIEECVKSHELWMESQSHYMAEVVNKFYDEKKVMNELNKANHDQSPGVVNDDNSKSNEGNISGTKTKQKIISFFGKK